MIDVGALKKFQSFFVEQGGYIIDSSNHQTMGGRFLSNPRR